MELNDLVERVHETAVRHGFWNPAPEIGTSIALIHSELSEALEEARAGKANVFTTREATSQRVLLHG